MAILTEENESPIPQTMEGFIDLMMGITVAHATAQLRSSIEHLSYERSRKLHAELRRMVTQLEGRHNLGRVK